MHPEVCHYRPMECLRSISVCFLLLVLTKLSFAAQLTVRVDSTFVDPASLVMLELYAVPEGERSWASMSVLQHHKVVASDVLVLGLPEGRYALRGYVDVDASQHLTMGAKRRPLEPFGFSVAQGRSKASLKLRHAVIELPASGAEARFLFFPVRRP